MKNLTVIVTSAVLMMAGTAYAGGCNYGMKQAHVVDAEPLPAQSAASAEATDPKLVALLKDKKQDKVQPVIHN